MSNERQTSVGLVNLYSGSGAVKDNIKPLADRKADAKLRQQPSFDPAIVQSYLNELVSPLKMSGGSCHIASCSAPERIETAKNDPSLLDNVVSFFSSFNFHIADRPVQVAIQSDKSQGRS